MIPKHSKTTKNNRYFLLVLPFYRFAVSSGPMVSDLSPVQHRNFFQLARASCQKQMFLYYRETATPTPPAHHPRLVCAVQGRSELQRILVDVLRARSARFPMGPRGPFGAPGCSSGPQGPLGYFRRHSCRKIRVILPSLAPTAGRTTEHATLCVRGFKFSMPGTKRVRVLGALRPWASEGSSFPRWADRMV